MITKELQDLAWSVLPKEFKEEVKKIYSALLANIKKYQGDNQEPVGTTDPILWESTLVIKSTLFRIFGEHNLTSDAEGEENEMLCVSRKQVQNLYNYHKSRGHHLAGESLIKLFGSKCLPDEVADEDNFASKEPKFHVGQKVRFKGKDYGFEITEIGKWGDSDEYQYKLAGWRHSFRESRLEPYTEPNLDKSSSTCTNDCPSQPRNLSQDPANCDKSDSNRLHIAAMAMQGILSNIDLFKNVLETGMETLDGDRISCRAVAKASFLFADALINEAEKGDR